ncbi:hypothetical protein DMB44_08000 [Thermoplasma sp. Kam2015]|uniref:hypothetical protein n=1 Tax=Thermoplasma sp. Kam2015 TaxID=2094122 RepID=UPI000D971DBE|nr:hypothetical protein [Thermoplasma sp. Kam2015]PYB67660.1 hypothetical protein DMB44_08000 [Thermoplasma sp. Kam2015]
MSEGSKFKLAVPREHGLIVVWANTLIISLISNFRFSIYGIVTFLIMLTTFFLYDPILSALRVWKAKRGPLRFLYANHAYVFVIGPLLLGWILYITVIHVIPVTPLLFFAVFLATYVALFRYGERKLYTRIFSILTLTSMFLIVSSSFVHLLTIRNITIFLVLSAGEVLMGSGPVEIANARMMKIRFERLFFHRILPVYVSSILVLIPDLLISYPMVFYVFSAIFTVAALSTIAVKDLPMKKIGFVATGFNLAILVGVIVLYK